jgi:excisionase family DNA binding protein
VSQLLTLSEVCARVRLSPWAVRRAIGRGELAAYKLSGRLRIPESALEDWLRAAAIKPGDIVPQRAARRREPSQQLTTFRARLRKEPEDERAQSPAA